MRIAITNPTYWPYLRRGVERFMNDFAIYLKHRRHEVTIITGKPGKTEVVVDNGVTVIYCRRLWHPVLMKLGILEFHLFFFTALARLLRRKYDVVFCCTFMDGFAAQVARSITGTPYTFTCFAQPPKIQHYRSLTTKGSIFKRTISRADAFLSISQYVSDYFKQRWDIESLVQFLPVDTTAFQQLEHPAGSPPIILCAAALDDPRKGGRILMRAFERLKHKRPDLQLQIAWNLKPELHSEFSSLVSPNWRKDIHFLGTDVDLPRLFALASVSVLPSLWESQGMVVLESLASGTPVVCTRDGALPEILTDPEVGRLFDPGPDTLYEPTNLEGLVQALDEALDLSALPETSRKCRAYAEQFGWEGQGARWEDLLYRVSRKARSATFAMDGSE
jgi:glycosyltransferase involved in cell wall biosynthesis